MLELDVSNSVITPAEPEKKFLVVLQLAEIAVATRYAVGLTEQEVPEIATLSSNVCFCHVSAMSGHMSGDVSGHLFGHVSGHMSGHLSGLVSGHVSGNMS